MTIRRISLIATALCPLWLCVLVLPGSPAKQVQLRYPSHVFETQRNIKRGPYFDRPELCEEKSQALAGSAPKGWLFPNANYFRRC
jgi:hypothetical protein